MTTAHSILSNHFSYPTFQKDCSRLKWLIVYQKASFLLKYLHILQYLVNQTLSLHQEALQFYADPLKLDLKHMQLSLISATIKCSYLNLLPMIKLCKR